MEFAVGRGEEGVHTTGAPGFERAIVLPFLLLINQ